MWEEANDMSKGVALVTGASRGIGRGIALCLAEHGYDIVGAATTEQGLSDIKEAVLALGQRFSPVVGDISNQEDHGGMIERVLEDFGRVDVLVNNAGVAPTIRLDVLETTRESYDRVMAINLAGPYFFTQRVAKQMIAQVAADEGVNAPRIVFVTSISATTSSSNRAEYCVSKAGLSMTAQCFAVRLAEYGINVYDVQPGLITTDMTAGVQEKYEALIQGGLLLQPRWGKPEDVGKAVLALVDGYFDYATGAVIEVGGGFGIKRL